MNNDIPKCKVYFTMNSNNQSFRVNIPMDITENTMFYVSTVIGKANQTNLGVFLHSPDISTNQIYDCNTGNNTQLTSFVLQNYATKPITGIVNSTDIGYIAPHYLNNNPNVSFQLKDVNGALIASNLIDYVQVGLEFYNYGI